jgi:NodT family efflux transporter outer membrane factor (OMF) lipoprotein
MLGLGRLRSPRAIHLSLFAALLLLSGCVAVGPNYVPPEFAVQDNWDVDTLEGVQVSASEQVKWWTLFDDPILSELVERAVTGNLDLRAAVSRIDEARALLGVTRGARFPNLDSEVSYTRSRQSEESSIGGTKVGSLVSVNDTDNYGASLGAAWELDLFGRIRRSVEASKANWEASVEDYHGVLVSLQAEIALSYIDIRSLQHRIDIAKKNIASQQQSLNLVQKRYGAGKAPGLEFSQAKANLASTKATLPQLHAALDSALHRLSVLLGEHPGATQIELKTKTPIPSPPDTIVIDIPANLLRQRPDLRRAERLLAAQTAKVGMTTANLYPTLSLGGAFGFSAQSPGDLFQASSRTYGVGPTFSWNVFSGGRIRSAIDVEDARVEQALTAYEHTLLKAIEEVENSLANYHYERVRGDELSSALTAYRDAAGFAKELYKSGKTDFQNVLDAERNVLTFEDQLSRSRAALVSNVVTLYRSMGGGWRTSNAVGDLVIQSDDTNMQGDN